MNRDMSLALKLQADPSRFNSGLAQGVRGLKRFGSAVKNEFNALKNAMGSVKGQLATLGVTVGGMATLAQSARMDKSLAQIGQTAGASKHEVANLRKELFRMSGETGQGVEDLQSGFNNAVQAGLSFKEALPVLDATNKAMAVTGANADSLTSGLKVAATAFKFDLSKPEMALSLLDKMLVAGRLGSAELKNLPDIFGRIGVNAASAGMSFDKTLAFVEALSFAEDSPERLATLADSTMRVFTNENYMTASSRATGVKFFDAKGARRDAFDVLKDIKVKYDKLKNDRERSGFIQKAFGKTDLDTIKGLRTLLGGNMLSKAEGFSREISGAGGALEKDLSDAINNAIDQTSRLKAQLRKAADDFVQPINETFSNVIRWGLDKKENGGLGLDGKDMIVGGGALAIGTAVAARYGSKGISGLAKRFGGTATGVAEGKALQAMAGVTPVFVVNWPASMGGGMDLPGVPKSVGGLGGAAGGAAGAATKIGGVRSAKSLAALASVLPVSSWGALGARGIAMATGSVGMAGMAGYGVGSAMNWAGEKLAKGTRMEGFGTDVIGGAIAKTLAFFGNETAKQAVALTETLKQAEIKAKLDININGAPASVTATSKTPNLSMNVDNGYLMSLP